MLFQPTYFSPISQYVAIAKANTIKFEFEDNFQKQTYRNRCYIYTANGKHLLNVPIQHSKGVKQKTKDVKIDYKDDWNKQHLKTLETAYSSSPFFEYYIDDLLPIFTKKIDFLIDLNIETHCFILDALQLNIPFTKTIDFEVEAKEDYRNLAIAKTKQVFNFKRYIQVFEQNHGFIPNLSMLDLIFMEGPNALNYLENQQLNF
ncbi:WbqC-like protein family protein [Lutibacter oricola]|uniref:WbqC-like protein family protein n=1 Tax=Lutibacter oricola TaxID=762486 RepID=A0A1H3C743_9FLAO|nr:WbqC family protein [Lutibacter oricola]SDX49987.1 WbqC-like protein family protein [Lutibacter oricola]